MAIDRVFNTPTITVDQDRYDELVKAELKAEQYKNELERIGNHEQLIKIIEAEKNIPVGITENENKKEKESEEK